MNATKIPGNEPDSGDMSTQPGLGVPDHQSAEHSVSDADAEEFGDLP